MQTSKSRRLLTRILAQLLVVAFLSLGVAGLALAETWTFSSPLGDVGSNTHPYDSSPPGVAITATAFTTATPSPTSGIWTPGALTPIDLFGKSAGIGETGLGLNGTSSNEIQNNTFISLDLQNLLNNGFTALTMSIGSIQNQEGYSLWKVAPVAGPSLSLALLRTEVGPSISDPADGIDTFTLPLNFGRYLYVSATPIVNSSSDVLIVDGASTVPLPGTLPLLGSGLLGLIGLRRRIFNS
jgi:hypothetical protein